MEDLNSVALVGRLVKDVELSYTNSGTALAKMSIAVNRRIKKGDQWLDEASFFNLVGWGKLYESISSLLKKGIQIAASGSLKQDRWDGADGQKRSAVVINIENIQILTQKRQNEFTDEIPI